MTMKWPNDINLDNQVRIAKKIINDPKESSLAKQLAKLVIELDEDITDGGILPTRWDNAQIGYQPD